MAIDLPESLSSKIWTETISIGQFGEMKFVKRENIHITMRFLGSITDEQVEKFKEMMDSLVFSQFKIKLTGIGVFPSLSHARVIWVGISEGEEKVIELGKKLGSTDLTPHVTVARVNSLQKRKGLRDYIKKNESKEFGEFACTGVVLYKSELGHDGAQYTKLYEKKFTSVL